MTVGTISPAARLLRGFATDFLTSHDPAAAEWVMDPDYCLSIGGHRFAGRDGFYLPATLAQLEQFPGLVVTVHDVILGEAGLALRFTEHGVSIRNPGRAAAWGGITLFRTEQGRLREGWAEEDYFARKRQLNNGRCDRVGTPHPAPWDEPVHRPDPATEEAVRRWLALPDALFSDPAVEQICAEGPGFAELVEPQTLTIDTLFTAGTRAAFHLVCEGGYAGGFPDIDPALAGRKLSLSVAGILDVMDGAVSRVQLSADRLGLHRAMLNLT